MAKYCSRQACYTTWHTGRGVKVRIWEDKWLGSLPPLRVILPPKKKKMQGALSFQFPSLSLSLHDRATISLSTRTWLPFSLHILHPLTRMSVSTIGLRVWGGWLYLPLTSRYRMVFLEIGYVYFSFQLSLQFKTKFLLYNSKFNSI